MLASIPRFHDLLHPPRGHEPFLLAARALTPIMAISRRRFFVSFAARALPPLLANLRIASRSALVGGIMDAISAQIAATCKQAVTY